MDGALYRELLDEAAEPVVLADAALVVEYLNARARMEFGEGALGRPVQDLMAVDTDNGVPEAGAGWRVVNVHGHWAFFGRTGGAEGTDAPWVQQLLQSEQLAAVGQLSAAVVHEIGAPLTAIEMAADRLARRQEVAGSLQDDDRELILAQTHRIAQLSRLLTNLAGPGAPHLRPVDVNEVVREVGEIMGRSLEADGIESALSLEGDLPRIKSDPRRIQQVLITLLSNARAAMPGGGRLDVSTRRKGDWVALTVKDSGGGIPREDLSRIFLPFFSRSGGTGLGLPLARQLVHSLGGTISVQSEEGQGATFVILLPGVASGAAARGRHD